MRELVAQLRPAVGFVKSGHSCGSGFLVQDGNFLTCAHVVASDDTVVCLNQEELPATLLHRCDEYDLAVLSLSACKAGHEGIEVGTYESVHEGDELLILGFPAGEHLLTAIRGMVAAKTAINNLRVIKLDATVAPGLSGSPCVHVPSRKVIGIVSSQVPATAVLPDVLQRIDKLVVDAGKLENEAQSITRHLEARSGGVWISSVDTNAALADVFGRIAGIAADLKAVGESMARFADRIPLGMGYAISIEYYNEPFATRGSSHVG